MSEKKKEKKQRRRHSEEYKVEVVKRMGECKNIEGLGRELGLDVKMM
jgi:transposase-like protein